MTGVIETALYVDDLPRSRQFYEQTLALEVLDATDRLCVLAAGGHDVLLLFHRGAMVDDLETSGGVIPGHDGTGPLHVGLGVRAEDLEAWEARLAADGVAIESRVRWPLGGQSVYFRDPDGHLVELLTPGIWRVY
ncbi:MAG: VOC family protein [Mycobacterium sp.]